MRFSMLRSRALGCAACVLLACGSESGLDGTRSAWQDPAEALSGGNRKPVIESVRLLPAEPAPGDRVEAIVRASDLDGDPLELAFSWQVDGQARPGSEGQFDLAGVERGSRVEVRVTASDGSQESSESARVVVRNRRPVITGLSLEPAGEVARGESLKARVATRDPDGDVVDVRFEWRVNGLAVEGKGDTLPTDALVRGDQVRVLAVAGDGEHEGAALESAPVRVVNGPPVILSQPGGFTQDGSFHYRIEAADPDGDGPLRFTLRRGPPGMHLDRIEGELSWRASADQAGRHPVAVVVEDTHGGRRVQEFVLEVGAEGAQEPAALAR